MLGRSCLSTPSTEASCSPVSESFRFVHAISLDHFTRAEASCIPLFLQASDHAENARPARVPQLFAELHEATSLRWRAWEIQNQGSRGNLARLRDVLDGAVSQGVGSLGRVADRVC